MEINYAIQQLKGNEKIIRGMVDGISGEQARWRPEPKSWSILEVINHLYDEDRSDFRVRLDIILHNPGKPWPGINPQDWVTERSYNERDLAESVENFVREREKSIVWLDGLGTPDLETIYESSFGSMRAGDMVSAWVAHDLLHMRQLVELKWAYTNYMLLPYETAYAGDW